MKTETEQPELSPTQIAIETAIQAEQGYRTIRRVTGSRAVVQAVLAFTLALSSAATAVKTVFAADSTDSKPGQSVPSNTLLDTYHLNNSIPDLDTRYVPGANLRNIAMPSEPPYQAPESLHLTNHWPVPDISRVSFSVNNRLTALLIPVATGLMESSQTPQAPFTIDIITLYSDQRKNGRPDSYTHLPIISTESGLMWAIFAMSDSGVLQTPNEFSNTENLVAIPIVVQKGRETASLSVMDVSDEIIASLESPILADGSIPILVKRGDDVLFFIDPISGSEFKLLDITGGDNENGLGAKVAALIKFEQPSLPADLMNDASYAAEIKQEGYAWEYRANKNEIWVDYQRNGNPELAFTLNPETKKWEVEKFIYTVDGPEVTADGMICKTPDGKCFTTREDTPNDFYFKFRTTGEWTMERRRDLTTGGVLPGYIYYNKAVSRRDANSQEFTKFITFQLDMGNGLNRISFPGEQLNMPIMTIFDLAKKYQPRREFTWGFSWKPTNKYQGIDYYDFYRPLIPVYNDFFRDRDDGSFIMFPSQIPTGLLL